MIPWQARHHYCFCHCYWHFFCFRYRHCLRKRYRSFFQCHACYIVRHRVMHRSDYRLRSGQYCLYRYWLCDYDVYRVWCGCHRPRCFLYGYKLLWKNNFKSRSLWVGHRHLYRYSYGRQYSSSYYFRYPSLLASVRSLLSIFSQMLQLISWWTSLRLPFVLKLLMLISLALFNGEPFHKHDFDYYFVVAVSVAVTVANPDAVSVHVAITTVVTEDAVLCLCCDYSFCFLFTCHFNWFFLNCESVNCTVIWLGLVMWWWYTKILQVQLS